MYAAVVSAMRRAEKQRVGSVATCAGCALDRHRGGGHPPTSATPPYVRVRIRRFEKVTSALPRTTMEVPSDLRYAFESPTDRALAFARYQGPSPLPAVLLASRGR